MKKKVALMIICICTSFLMGCGTVMELSEDESRLIAEYVAEKLLKYDSSYVDRLEEGEENTQALSTENLENDSDTREESFSEEVGQLEELKKENLTQTIENTLSEDRSQEVPVVGEEENIAKIAGIEGIDILYKDYSIVDQYPALDEQGEFIYLEASKGYQLLVLHFQITNVSSRMKQISLLDSGLDYRIVCNGSKAANPMLTILMDDLGTIETNIDTGSSQEAVLIFQLSDDLQENLESMDLYVMYDDFENVIHVLR